MVERNCIVPLRLVHISDIHFRGSGSWDLDEDQRHELLLDIQRLVTAGGSIDGIMVGGDIAFRAAPEEYAIANKWLDELRTACGGLDPARVWTVPGNHDINRATVGKSQVLQQFHTDVRDCDLDQLDVLISRRLSEDPVGPQLMLPFAEYNEFAGPYQCSTTSSQPHWYDESLELDGLVVRLLGLNSAIVSDWEDGRTRNAPSSY